MRKEKTHMAVVGAAHWVGVAGRATSNAYDSDGRAGEPNKHSKVLKGNTEQAEDCGGIGIGRLSSSTSAPEFREGK